MKEVEESELEERDCIDLGDGTASPDLDDKVSPIEGFDESHSWVQEDSQDTLLTVRQMPKDIAKLIEKLLLEDNTEKAEDEVYSTLWDFGGQSVYYATHPLFLTERAIYFLVYNLSRDPDEKASPQMKKGVYRDIKDDFCEWNNWAYLDFWMSSVASLVTQNEELQEGFATEMLPGRRLPPVFLVCTHADKPYNGRHPEELAREIYGSLRARIHGNHLHGVFVVDNTKSGSGSECPGVTCLRKEVLAVAKELPQMKEPVPIKWLKYEKALQGLLQDGYKWIHLDKAKEIALNVCKISSDEQFLALLNFLHDQRVLIHFDDTPELSEMIFLDPQWLIDVFKKVICITPYDNKETNFTELWLKLEKTGILEEKLLQHVWGPLFDDRETYKSLIALMEKFCLLCPWPKSVGGETRTEYLVPSMLLFPPKEETAKLFASAGIQPLFLNFTSGQVPPGLFPRLVLLLFQWCSKEFPCQTNPLLHRNFARFFTHPAEGCSIVLLCHSSYIEIVVHKDSTAGAIVTEASANVLSVGLLPFEFSFDNLQVTVARILYRQLGLILVCMRREFSWLKNMTYEMSVCCPVCCQKGSVTYCQNHHVYSCKQEECLHFWSERQLRDCEDFAICTKSAFAGDCRVPVKLFKHWFTFLDKQIAIDGRTKRFLPREKGEDERALSLPSEVSEALQLQNSDPREVIAKFQESLSLEPSSLEQPNAETKLWIRCFSRKALSADRTDVVEILRGIVPAGTTGPLLLEARDVMDISVKTAQTLTVNLSGRDEWKLFAERLGLNPAEILYLDKRVINPSEAALVHSRRQGYICSVGELYDALVDCELPLLADLL